MPGGKQRLKGLFTAGLINRGNMTQGANGTAIAQMLAGSTTVAGPVYPGGASTVTGSKGTAEITITNMAADDVLFCSVSGLSASVRFDHEVEAGAGTASLVFRYSGCAASVDPYTVRVRYLAIKLG